MGPGDTCMLVDWQVKPANAWGTTLGETHPRCGELSASPGPSTTALPWRVASSQVEGTEVQLWAGIGSHCVA
eukprot:3841328-Alexandrium_andersonii.AAC.1